jgi:hypothetical protein
MRCVLAAFVVAAFIVLNLAVSPAGANDFSAVITGYVYDQDGVPLRNATVYAYSRSSPPAVRSTNGDGFFVFLGMLPDRYAVTATAPGHRPGCRSAAVIYPNQTWRVSLFVFPTSAHVDCWFGEVQDFGISF